MCASIYSKPVQAKVLVVASDEWCPYICDDTHLPGFLVEIVTEIAASNGVKANFILTPLLAAISVTISTKREK